MEEVCSSVSFDQGLTLRVLSTHIIWDHMSLGVQIFCILYDFTEEREKNEHFQTGTIVGFFEHGLFVGSFDEK